MSTLQDLWDSIREKVQDLMDTISDYLPAGSAIPIASGLAILLSLIAILNTAGAGKTAGRLEDNAMKYKAGQQQLNSVLGSKEEIDFSKDSNEIIGRTNLVLQYKDLSTLPSDAGITNMEKTLNVDDNAVANENSNYDDSMIDQIVDFAGDYGGVLIAPGSTSSSNIKVAAFSSQNKMKSVADDVSNVLYEKINRTIAGKKYGDSTTRNSLVILSASKVNGLKSVSKGSVLYSLFGESTGTKARGKYICTKVEPGKAAGGYSDAEVEEDTSSEETQADTSSENAAEEQTSIDGAIDSYSENDEEATVTPKTGSDAVPHTDGNGVVVITEDDTVYNGGAYNNDGSVNDEWIKENSDDSEEDSSDSKNKASSDDSYQNEVSGAESSESSAYANEDSLGYTDRDKASAATILDAQGNPLTENTTADLILYQYDKKTGSIVITYWNYSNSSAATAALAS